MTEKIAIELIKQYVMGWKQNDLKKICSCLLESCIIIESHGPRYHGIQDVERWFRLWIAAKSKVTKWDILSFYHCNQDETTIFEWDFACISKNIDHSFLGISVIKITDNKIFSIHEYRMTKPKYD